MHWSSTLFAHTSAVLLGTTLLLFLIEFLAGRYRGVFRREDFFVIGLCAAISRAMKPVVVLVTGTLIGLALPPWKGALAHLPLLASYLGLLTITEFAFYFAHRLAHRGQSDPRWAWLWMLHRTHHAGPYMNVLVTMRIIPLWILVVPTTWTLAVAVYLGQPKAAALTILTIHGWNLITHANFRWDDPIRRAPVIGRAFRALEHVLVSPGVHHTHHGYGHDGKLYRNYAVTFAFIDWMFGTLHIPRGRPARYGVPGERPWWPEEVFYPFVRDRRPGRRATDGPQAEAPAA